jgi:hypothetical protein
MSLTSYRAAPPRDKPLRALSNAETNLANAQARRSILSGGFLRRQPWPKALGCEAYVPTPVHFGKGPEAIFEDFMTIKNRHFAPKRPLPKALLPEVTQKPSFAAKT